MGNALLAIAVLLALLLLLLAVPVDVAFRFERIEEFKGHVAIRWLFGLIRFHIDVPNAVKSARPHPKPEPVAAAVRKKPAARNGRLNVLAALGQAAFRRRIYRFARDLLRAAHARQLFLHLRLGLGDPADTGRLWGFVGPLAALAQSLRNANVHIEPEFMDPVLELRTHGRFMLIPLQFLALATAFALSPASIRAWRTLKRRHA